MRQMGRFSTLFKYELFNVLRGRWLIVYALLFAGFAEALLQFGTDRGKAVVSLLSVVLLVVPMVSMLYASVYWYGAESFTSLLLTQPVRRRQIYLSRWLAVSGALAFSSGAGLFLPIALNEAVDGPAILLLAMSFILTFVFVAIGMLSSVLVSDRMKGIGAAFLAWFYFAIVHDGLVFGILSLFRDYPMELPSMGLSAASPIDLARIVMLMSIDFSALMGYTGVILQRFLSGVLGPLLVAGALLTWLAAPVALGLSRFERRDF